MRLVILETPYAGSIRRNVAYARACMRDCLERGEAPFASHLLYTQPLVLDDTKKEERETGMRAGWAWIPQATASVVYVDHGISGGMREGIRIAKAAGVPIEYRSLAEPRDLGPADKDEP